MSGWQRLAAAALLLVACGASPGTPDRPEQLQTELLADPTAFFLEVTRSSGILPVEHTFNQPPQFAATVGGQLLVAGQILEAPGPMLPPASWLDIGQTAQPGILEAIARARLHEANRVVILEPSGNIADLSSTRFTFTTRSGSRWISVEGLGIESHTDPRVRRLRELLRRLEQAAASGTPADPGPPRLQIYVNAVPHPADPAHLIEHAWPLAEPPQLPSERGFVCRLVDGDAATSLLAVFDAANLAARWVYDGRPHQLLVRQLFPGEAACRS